MNMPVIRHIRRYMERSFDSMKCMPSDLFSEVIIIEPDIFHDARGYFLETFTTSKYREMGITERFVQDNLSFSGKGTLRGLHYQLERPQGKLIYAVHGEIFDVIVDIRKGSPSFGKWQGITLSSDNHRQVYIPGGFAHGFSVVSEKACVAYKCTDYYDPLTEHGIIWNDPAISIDWPVSDPVLSDKDRSYPKLGELSGNDLPVYQSKRIEQ